MLYRSVGDNPFVWLGRPSPTAVPEKNLGLAFKAISQYFNRWKEASAKYYDDEAYMKKGNNCEVMFIVAGEQHL